MKSKPLGTGVGPFSGWLDAERKAGEGEEAAGEKKKDDKASESKDCPAPNTFVPHGEHMFKGPGAHFGSDAAHFQGRIRTPLTLGRDPSTT